uniref:Alveolin domain containing intermediate filament IMC11 n=1 Tax=Toxoplasma gondii (strain ATCC 50861 / VEG) TaxID=432359 RepID=A0A0F7UXW9_TOXGV|nr:TPA: alveolin domain containing intermediate filament IMC11 [Toxoplasma gondii VEG]
MSGCQQNDWQRRKYILGAHGLSHCRSWKQDFVDSRVLKPSVVGEKCDRDWVRVLVLQPVDIKTKFVQVPVVKKVDRFVPKVTYEEKLVEVPRLIHKTVEKFVEKPYIKYVDKYEEVPETRYMYKYVPKEVIHERVSYKRKPVTFDKVTYKEMPQIKYVDRYVDVPMFEEVVRYEPAPHIPPLHQDDVSESTIQEHSPGTRQIPTDDQYRVR